MNWIINKVIDDLTALGITKGDNLLVHSSLHSLGDFNGKAKTVTEALLNVIGKSGTLLMPALSYETVGKDNPYFEVNKTPSCVGGLTEYFRLRDDTERSIHPTHSVSGVGLNVEYFLKDHYLDNTPVGENSPFVKLKKVCGKILFIGCGLNPNTSMHGIEELVKPPYLFDGETLYTLTDKSGKQFKKKYMNHNFKGYKQRYDRMESLLDEKYLVKGKIMKADAYLMSSSELWKVAHKKLRLDPLYFVDRVTE